ncbi:uncharacterized protein [Montipora foliosa]|uniref:uncharacterized protein isoform X2 n=1 Tax=Montipora foliosa TaxID=591990 RepID=UPI0035F20CD7
MDLVSGPDRQRTIESELEMVKKSLSEKIEGCEILSCHPVAVNVRITRTKFKSVVAVLQFPEKYPTSAVIVEIKSKTLSPRLLIKLTELCDQEAKKLLGRQQVIPVLSFVRRFLDENPLIACSEELQYIKSRLLTEVDQLKVKQKAGILNICANQDKYFLDVKIAVPDDYHTAAVRNPPFEPKPSLKLVCDFLVAECVRVCPRETCPICQKRALPEDPKEAITDPTDPQFVERIYCNHLFHFGCLDKYMKTPPFQGGKKCPSCKQRIYHERWKVTPRLAEERWAHHEAKKRELSEVVDFLGDCL